MERNIKDKKSLEEIKTLLCQNGIRLPEEFDERMKEASKKLFNGRLPVMAAFENLLRACQYWKPYCVTEEDYNDLVCNACYRMAEINCSVYSTHKDLSSYVGKVCNVQNLPDCTTTVAAPRRAFVYEGMGCAERVFSPLR